MSERPAQLVVLPDAPCDGCHGGCCAEYRVPVDGFDLVRLWRHVGGAWRDLVDFECRPSPIGMGLRIEPGRDHFTFILRRHADGACRFLVDQRCSVHPARPGACRSYPGAIDDERPVLKGHVVCPPERAAAWAALLQRDESIYDDLADRELWIRALARWDCAARRAAHTFDDFFDWVAALYVAIEALRSDDRGGWQLAAYRLIDDFPLPAMC
jgi:Fe-S-cluster containining protein